jgi:hypothetical protein
MDLTGGKSESMARASATQPDDDHAAIRRALRTVVDWLFRDRRTGRVVIVQAPNSPLVLFLVAAGVRGFIHPHGTAGTIVTVVATASLLWWAGDEVARGVNPFRRLLGAAVLATTLAGLVFR